MRTAIIRSALLAAALASASLFGQRGDAQSSRSLDELLRATHVHGLAFDSGTPGRLLIATHHGLHALDVDSEAVENVAGIRDDFMGFTPDPGEPGRLYASGHPATGGNLGVIASDDGGRTWKFLSPGAGGPVDFHQMDVSKADPSVLYGIHGGVQVSRDGGRSWSIAGPAPEGVIDIAASALDPFRLYYGTRDGMAVSPDGGASWQRANLPRRPVSMVEVTGEGEIYAFVVGNGLIRGDEATWTWRTLSNGFGDRVLLHLAVDLHDPGRLAAATHQGEILVSRDAGLTWEVLAAP